MTGGKVRDIGGLTDGDDLDDLVSDHYGSDRDTVGERLGHGDDVGPEGKEKWRPVSAVMDD